MITVIKNWASGIVVAVIIATLIEMILPDNKNKKYIKTVLGVYLLFTILSPMISHALEGGSFDVSKYESYLEEIEESSTLSSRFEMDNSKSIQKIYEEQLKEDIKVKLKAKGFQVQKLEVAIVTKEGETYGSIQKMNISVTKSEEKEQAEENKTENEIKINTVEIGIAENKMADTKTTRSMTEKEKQQIKEYLSEEYGIQKKNITLE